MLPGYSQFHKSSINLKCVSNRNIAIIRITRDSKDGKSGLTVIFAFENFVESKGKREGTEYEISNLESLFTRMNLRVHLLRNLKLAQMKLALTGSTILL